MIAARPGSLTSEAVLACIKTADRRRKDGGIRGAPKLAGARVPGTSGLLSRQSRQSPLPTRTLAYCRELASDGDIPIISMKHEGADPPRTLLVRKVPPIGSRKGTSIQVIPSLSPS